MTPRSAHVFLVGAGPGDPGLITVRGLELLRRAEVVLYDRLVDPRLVEEAPGEAERIFVGKTPGGPSMPQAEIDALIVDRARKGSRVVRLKGGDPFVFGRGADEAQALVAAGIAFEIVPGVTSAIAVPAYAGIPVTHSGASSSFAVLTAHESAARPGADERWADVARGAGTLVLMMGVGGLADTMERLIAAGRDASEPAAVIERGTTRAQRTVVATVGTLADEAAGAGIGSPAVTVVGPVVRLRDALAWVESRPLFGRRVLVTRPRADSLELLSELERLGAEAIAMPLIETQPLAETGELDVLLLDDGFDWIAFASHNAVETILERLRALKTKLHPRVAALGPRTAGALIDGGVHPDVVATEATGAGLAAALGPGTGRVLVPTSEGRHSRLAEELEALGWDCVRAAAYRTVAREPAPWQAQIVRSGDYDALVFASGSAVEAFAELFGSDGPDPVPPTVAIGPTTAAALSERGLQAGAVASEPTTHGLVHAVLNLLAGRPPV